MISERSLIVISFNIRSFISHEASLKVIYSIDSLLSSIFGAFIGFLFLFI